MLFGKMQVALRNMVVGKARPNRRQFLAGKQLGLLVDPSILHKRLDAIVDGSWPALEYSAM